MKQILVTITAKLLLAATAGLVAHWFHAPAWGIFLTMLVVYFA